jgi:hypothetical protein
MGVSFETSGVRSSGFPASLFWELSTLAAAWHHACGGKRPDLARALEFYDGWLPVTMRRVAHITRACDPDCVTRRHRPW